MTSDVRAALEAGDDGFHEIQLNGKQLVFLGMATTLVSVVIFLCGVLVGRGVKPLDTVAQAAGPAGVRDAGDQPGRARRHRHARPGPPATPPARRRRRGRGRRGGARPPATPSRRRSATSPTPSGARAGERPAAAARAKPPSRRTERRPKVEPREAAKPKPAPVQASAAPPAPAPWPEPAPAPAAAAATAPASRRRRNRRPGRRVHHPQARPTRWRSGSAAGLRRLRDEPDGRRQERSIASASATTAPPTKRSASAPG